MKTKSNSISRNVVLSLIFGLTAMGTAPTVGATVVVPVDIIDGRVDVIRNTVINGFDDLNNVFLWCQGAAAVRVDVINGLVDVNEGGSALNNDDITSCDMTDETGVGAGGFPSRRRVNIINGFVDADNNGVINKFDDAVNIQLYTD
jgi:hypothetical protein